MASTGIDDERLEDTIAIVGVAGRFPGASTVEAFWENLRGGNESISFFEEDELRTAGVPETEWSHPSYVPAKGILDDIVGFDAGFFDMTPREASLVDPQHRLFLEICVEALERAGVLWGANDSPIGVFGGASKNTYLFLNLLSHPELHTSSTALRTLIANDKDYLSTRVSYKLGLRGPSLTVQTACSSSLVAVHLACQSVLSGDCELALAGGVAVDVPHRAGYIYEPGGIFSPDGHCRAFDASARGTVFGQGAGVVLLKRLPEAIEDGNEICATIRGSAINNDGANKVGFTAPSVTGQSEVIEDALIAAGVEADTVTYVEAHGTGTPLGDPIEVEALTRAFRRSSDRVAFCRIGSVKSNVGHLNAAAGITGLIKTVLALQQREIPPSLHLERPNPEIPFAGSPFVVCDRLTQWDEGDTPRRAGVSSFGIGGTNAHVILEEAPSASTSEQASSERASSKWQLILTSGRTPSALTAAVSALSGDLGGRADLELADIAYTQQMGRRAHMHRVAVVSHDAAGGAKALANVSLRRIGRPARERPKVALIFSGQGSQYSGMARGLHKLHPTFREAFEACCDDLSAAGAHDPRLLLSPVEHGPGAGQSASRTDVAQPALFAVEYALAQLWASWGVVPAALAGHSVGEIVAACVAGVFDRAGAAQLIAERARLMGQQSNGAMLAVRRSAEELVEGLPAEVEIAAINADDVTVLSGHESAIEEVRTELVAHGVAVQRLHTSHAFHSTAMEATIEPFTACVSAIERRPPVLPLVSNVSGDWLTDEEAMSSAYWGRHLRLPVRFSDCIGTLLRSGNTVLLEVGPGSTLSQLVRRRADWSDTHTIAHSLPDHSEGDGHEERTILEALGRLWTAGVQPRWEALHRGVRRRTVILPTYPFERARHWIDPYPRPDVSGVDAIPVAPHISPTVPVPVSTSRSTTPIVTSATAHRISTAVATIFEEILGVPRVTGQDDFFDLGGHSLYGAELIARLRDVLGVELPLGAVFRAPCPDEIAALAVIASVNGSGALDDHGNLAQEDIWIADDIGVPSAMSVARTGAADILLTGGTGFLGVFLLRELLRQTTSGVRCLVRCDEPASGRERLSKALQFYDLLDSVDLGRVEIVPGDLSREWFGLDAQAYAELAANVDCVLHNGARVSFQEPYRRLRHTNVHGTREILRFASYAGGIPVSHVSSIAVFDCEAFKIMDIAGEDEDLSSGGGFHDGYDESKWVSEQVVALARERGIPVTIYRPGNIAGDSRTGAISDGHLVSAMLKGCITLGVAPDSDAFVDVVPVDYVSCALVAISQRAEWQNSTFHLVNPTAVRWNEIVQHLNAVGYEIELIPPAQWRSAIRTDTREDNPLRIFLPTFEERALFSGRRYRSEGTRAALAGTGIECPPLNRGLIATYVRALVSRGVLAASAGQTTL